MKEVKVWIICLFNQLTSSLIISDANNFAEYKWYGIIQFEGSPYVDVINPEDETASVSHSEANDAALFFSSLSITSFIIL